MTSLSDDIAELPAIPMEAYKILARVRLEQIERRLLTGDVPDRQRLLDQRGALRRFLGAD